MRPATATHVSPARSSARARARRQVAQQARVIGADSVVSPSQPPPRLDGPVEGPGSVRLIHAQPLRAAPRQRSVRRLVCTPLPITDPRCVHMPAKPDRAAWDAVPGAPRRPPRPGAQRAVDRHIRLRARPRLAEPCHHQRRGRSIRTSRRVWQDVQGGRNMSWWRSRRVQAALSVVTVALVFGFLLPQLADYGAAWTSITRMSWLELVLMVGLALSEPGRLHAAADFRPARAHRPPRRTVSDFRVDGDLRRPARRRCAWVGVTVTIQARLGHPAPDVALGADRCCGIWNSFVRLGLPVLALGLVVIAGDVPQRAARRRRGRRGRAGGDDGLHAPAAQPGAGPRRRRRGASRRRPLRLLKRAPRTGWADGAARFRTRTIGLIAGRARRITVATLLNHVSLYLVLLVCLRAVGVPEHAVG